MRSDEALMGTHYQRYLHLQIRQPVSHNIASSARRISEHNDCGGSR